MNARDWSTIPVSRIDQTNFVEQASDMKRSKKVE